MLCNRRCVVAVECCWRRSWGSCSVLQLKLCKNCPCPGGAILPFWESFARVNVFLRFLSYWCTEMQNTLGSVFFFFSVFSFLSSALSVPSMKYFISNLTHEEQLGGGRGRHCRLALYHLGCLISLAWEPSQTPQAMHLLMDPTWENLLLLLHALAFINTISIIAIRIHYSQQKDKARNTYLWIEFVSALSWDCFILELFAVYILPSSRKKRKPLNCKTVWVKEMPRDDLSRMLKRWSMGPSQLTQPLNSQNCKLHLLQAQKLLSFPMLKTFCNSNKTTLERAI